MKEGNKQKGDHGEDGQDGDSEGDVFYGFFGKHVTYAYE